MLFADALRRVVLVARAILAIGLFAAVMYVLLAAPGLLTDDASIVPLSPTRSETSRRATSDCPRVPRRARPQGSRHSAESGDTGDASPAGRSRLERT